MTHCKGCGEEHDNPWGYCNDCTAVLLDLSRDKQYRLNTPETLTAQMQKIREYGQST